MADIASGTVSRAVYPYGEGNPSDGAHTELSCIPVNVTLGCSRPMVKSSNCHVSAAENRPGAVPFLFKNFLGELERAQKRSKC